MSINRTEHSRRTIVPMKEAAQIEKSTLGCTRKADLLTKLLEIITLRHYTVLDIPNRDTELRAWRTAAEENRVTFEIHPYENGEVVMDWEIISGDLSYGGPCLVTIKDDSDHIVEIMRDKRAVLVKLPDGSFLPVDDECRQLLDEVLVATGYYIPDSVK